MAGSRFVTLAAQTTALKYKPKYAALAAAIGEAQEAYKQTVGAGNATATLTTQAAKEALPAIQGAFGRADTANARLSSPDMAALPTTGVTAAFAGGQQDEVRQQLANLLTARAGAEAQNASVAPAAREGAQFNQVAARGTLATSLGKLLQQRSTLAGEEGSDTAATAATLAHEAEGNERQEKASIRSTTGAEHDALIAAGASENNSKRTAASKAHPAGGNYLPQEKQTAAASTVRAIEAEARAYWQKGVPRQHITQILAEGQPEEEEVVKKNGQVVISPATGKPETVKVPARKAYAPDVLMQAALDSVERSGQVSPGTLAQLHKAGYSIKALSLAPPAPPKSPSDLAKTVHKAFGF